MKFKTNFISIVITVLLSSPAIAQTYTVQPGDSIWKIAEKTKTQDVTVHQMIAAIHESNSSLLGADIASIKPGMELIIPDEASVSNADSKHATQLLAGTVSQSSTSTRTARIDSIQKQISRIESEINETIESLSSSQESFKAMVSQ